MIIGTTDHKGLCLSTDPTDSEAIKDMCIILDILNKHKITVGGYECPEGEATIEKWDGKIILDLGR